MVLGGTVFISSMMMVKVEGLGFMMTVVRSIVGFVVVVFVIVFVGRALRKEDR